MQTPSAQAPVVRPDGTAQPAWYRFFATIPNSPQPAASVTPGASPYSYTANSAGTLVISGGTVSSVQVTRGRTTIGAGMISGMFPAQQGDVFIITYSVVPTITFLPYL